MIHYQVYGLTFRVDRELPDLDRIQETSNVDYTLRFEDSTDRIKMLQVNLEYPWYISPWRVKSGRTVVKVWRSKGFRQFLFRFYDGVEFFVSQDRKDILVSGLQGASLQAATHHLLFSLPGFLLGLRGSTCLHGAVFGWGDGAIALLGKSYSGKSVLSAVMAARGGSVLSDDLVALDLIGGAVKVYPGYSWVSLRLGSLHWLKNHYEADRFCSKWRYLDEVYASLDLGRKGEALESKPRNLQAIYLLMPEGGPERKTTIEQIPRRQAMIALIEASARTHIPCREFRLQEFSLVGSVISAVPTYGLHCHLSADSLPDLSILLQRHAGSAVEK